MIFTAAPPLFESNWAVRHASEIGGALLQHVQLTLIAVVLGLVISVPLAVFAHRHRGFYPPLTWVTGFLYTIPSLALFAFLVPYTGLSALTAEIGLVGYTLLILIRNTVAALDGIPADAKEAARGMGFNSRQMLFKVEFPLALPVMVAGVRIATVTTIGLVTVTALIGKGGLGELILTGLNRFFPTPIIVGAGLSVVLALSADGLLLFAERRLAPWRRSQRASA